MQPIPTEFIKQWIARIREKSPRFFVIVQYIASGLMALSLVTYWVINSVYPGLHLDVPLWLEFTNGQLAALTSFLGGLGVGSWVVAKSMLPGVSPPLDQPKPETP